MHDFDIFFAERHLKNKDNKLFLLGIVISKTCKKGRINGKSFHHWLSIGLDF